MWFLFLLFRLAVLAFFCALPFLFWPPSLWLVVVCATMAGGIAAFGLLDPKRRILRLIATAVVAFLPLLSGTLGPEITKAMVPDAGLRDWLNFALNWVIAKDGTSPWALGALTLIILALIVLEGWRSYLEIKKDTETLRLRAITGTELWWFDQIVQRYTLEAIITAVNQTDQDVSFTTAQLSLWGQVDTEATLSHVQEGVFVLGPSEHLTIPANGELKFHVASVVSPKGLQGWLLKNLSNFVGRYLIPMPIKIKTAYANVWVNLWNAPRPERKTSKSALGDSALL